MSVIDTHTDVRHWHTLMSTLSDLIPGVWLGCLCKGQHPPPPDRPPAYDSIFRQCLLSLLYLVQLQRSTAQKSLMTPSSYCPPIIHPYPPTHGLHMPYRVIDSLNLTRLLRASLLTEGTPRWNEERRSVREHG